MSLRKENEVMMTTININGVTFVKGNDVLTKLNNLIEEVEDMLDIDPCDPSEVVAMWGDLTTELDDFYDDIEDLIKE